MFVNVHTHIPTTKPNTISILNLYKEFANAHLHPYVSLGLHPWYVSVHKVNDQFQELKQVANASNVLAIGECGLDKLMTTDWNLQLMVFERQIVLAEELQKPLIIHAVKAVNECLSILKGVNVPVVFHGVNQKMTTINPILDAGYYVSFGKSILTKNESAKESLKRVPLSQLFLETDDANLDVVDIYNAASSIKEISEEALNLQVYNNYKKVFQTI